MRKPMEIQMADFIVRQSHDTKLILDHNHNQFSVRICGAEKSHHPLA
jgi:hypothetical protein